MSTIDLIMHCPKNNKSKAWKYLMLYNMKDKKWLIIKPKY